MSWREYFGVAYEHPPKDDGAAPAAVENGKAAVGARKFGVSSLPWRVLVGVALATHEGRCKYGRHDFRVNGARASTYFDAVVGRHLTQWWEGEDIDAPSGLHHLDKAIAGLMIVRDAMLAGTFIDDRPPASKPFMDEANESAAAITDRYADRNVRDYTIKDGR